MATPKGIQVINSSTSQATGHAGLILFLLFLLSLGMAKSYAFDIDHSRSIISLTQHAKYFKDTSGKYTQLDILKNLRNIPWQTTDLESFTVGTTQSRFWVLLELTYRPDEATPNESIPKETAPYETIPKETGPSATTSHETATDSWILKLYYSQLSDVSLYDIERHKVLSATKFDDNNSYDRRSPHFLNLLNLKPGEKRSLLYSFDAFQGSAVRIALLTTAAYAHAAVIEQFIFGLIYGMLIAMSIYNFLNYLVMKNRLFLRFGLYCLFGCLFLASNSGHGLIYLWRQIPELNSIGIILFPYLALSCLIFFFMDFVSTQEVGNKNLHQIFLYSAYFIIPMAFISGFLKPQIIQFASGIFGSLLILFVITSQVYYIAIRAKNTLLFFSSFLLMGIGTGLTNSVRLGLLPSNLITENSLYIGFIVQLFILSSGMVNRVPLKITNIGSLTPPTSLNAAIEDKSAQFRYDRLKELFYNLETALFTCTPGGLVIDINSAAIKLLGFTDKMQLMQLDASILPQPILLEDENTEPLPKKSVLKTYLIGNNHSMIFGKLYFTIVQKADGRILNCSFLPDQQKDITEVGTEDWRNSLMPFSNLLEQASEKMSYQIVTTPENALDNTTENEFKNLELNYSFLNFRINNFSQLNQNNFHYAKNAPCHIGLINYELHRIAQFLYQTDSHLAKPTVRYPIPDFFTLAKQPLLSYFYLAIEYYLRIYPSEDLRLTISANCEIDQLEIFLTPSPVLSFKHESMGSTISIEQLENTNSWLTHLELTALKKILSEHKTFIALRKYRPEGYVLMASTAENNPTKHSRITLQNDAELEKSLLDISSQSQIEDG